MPPIQLALDARDIYRRHRRGTGKNLIDLYRHLARLHPQWQFVMFHQTHGLEDPFDELPNVRSPRIDIKGDRLNLWQQFRLPLAARTSHADIMHCPANTAPRFPGVPMVVTLHDLIPLDERFGAPASQKWARNVAAAARKARKIITPSLFSRQQIVRTFGISADKVIVNPWAPDSGCRKVTCAEELNRVRTERGLPADRPYVFGFGGADPRKNTVGTINAWARLSASLRADTALLLVGVQETALERFRRQVEQLGLADSCFVHGFAPEPDIPALLSGATALCYPSRSEGFGLPVLDAFVCDTPVVTSRTTSLPEIAGDAAIWVDPEDPRSIADGLTEILSNEGLRADLVERGRERVKRFTWKACAERAGRVFEEVLQ